MKQCLGKFHCHSTNKTKEMGEERRKVKSISVPQCWSSGRKFWMRALVSGALQDNLHPGMGLAPSTRPRGWRGLSLTQLACYLPKPGHCIYRVACPLAPTSCVDFRFKAGRAASLHRSYVHHSLIRLSKSLSKFSLPVDREQTTWRDMLRARHTARFSNFIT